MADIISISTLAGEFKNESDLQSYCNKQFQALTVAAKQVEELQKEIEELKNLLVTSNSLIENKLIITPEEATCLAQISILEQRSRTKELTLEETKKMDLWIKNLTLLRENNSKTIHIPIHKVDLDKKSLVNLAKQEYDNNSNE